eukprot:8915138-Alexandrium_andersonii.AAC.1
MHPPRKAGRPWRGRSGTSSTDHATPFPLAGRRCRGIITSGRWLRRTRPCQDVDQRRSLLARRALGQAMAQHATNVALRSGGAEQGSAAKGAAE